MVASSRKTMAPAILSLSVEGVTSSRCTTVALEHNQQVCLYSLPNSEGYASALCGNVITHIVHELNCDKTNVEYQF